MEHAEYRPGLEGVIAGITTLSNIDPEGDRLFYRGYDIQDLCRESTFEEVAYLLLYGELPNAPQLAEFAGWLDSERTVPEPVFAALRLAPPDSDPMDWLKVAVATLALYDPLVHASGHNANLEKAVRLTAKLPAVVAGGWRILHGQEPLEPRKERSTAAQFLYLLTGEEPDPFAAKVLTVSQILYAEHGFNASTFAARVTVSTLSDIYSGVVAAIGALKGPLHGGANEEVMRMMLEIGDVGKVEEWVKRRLTKTPENPHPRIMGFGHREYKHGDGRAAIAHDYTHELARRLADNRWVDIQDAIQSLMDARGLRPNLDFPVSAAYYMMGLPIPLYTPLFVMSRIVGWCAHIIEQLDANRIIRPTSLYQGPPPRQYVPMDQRR